MRFEWDADKSEANLLKHGIAFPEATALFRSNHITLELSGGVGEKR